MLSQTQFVIFELGATCNLGEYHKRCPNFVRMPTSLLSLTDDLILQCIEEAYTKLNFTGLVGWHYYNEPMMQHQRMFSLMEQYPKARYVLWTNGTIQPDDSRINLFEQVHCTNYSGNVNIKYYNGCKSVSMFTPVFDSRLQDTKYTIENDRLCYRQYTEFTIDNWGTAHFCCQDWRGEIEIGNLWQDTYATLVSRRHSIIEQMRRGEYTERCRRCTEKLRRVAKFDKEIRERTCTN